MSNLILLYCFQHTLLLHTLVLINFFIIFFDFCFFCFILNRTKRQKRFVFCNCKSLSYVKKLNLKIKLVLFIRSSNLLLTSCNRWDRIIFRTIQDFGFWFLTYGKMRVQHLKLSLFEDRSNMADVWNVVLTLSKTRLF